MSIRQTLFKMAHASISTIMLYTAVVVLAGSIIIPMWWNFDPLVKLIYDLRFTEGPGSGKTTENLLTKEELSKFGASVSNDKIYLGILGEVFDVSAGKKHYGKDGWYSFFTGMFKRLNKIPCLLRIS